MREFFAQLPDDSRRALFAAAPDNDGDGVPDFVQRHGQQTSLDASVTTTQGASGQARTVITVNGITYDSPDQVPPQIVEQLRRAGLAWPHSGPEPRRAAPPADATGSADHEGSPSWGSPSWSSPSWGSPASGSAAPAPSQPASPSLASISDQSELTRQMLGEAPPKKWWQFWKR